MFTDTTAVNIKEEPQESDDMTMPIKSGRPNLCDLLQMQFPDVSAAWSTMEFCGDGNTGRTVNDRTGKSRSEPQEPTEVYHRRFSCDVSKQECHLKANTKKYHAINQSAIECRICDKNFDSSSGLHFHNIMEHTDERPYKCHTCLISFKRNAPFSVHKRQFHGSVAMTKGPDDGSHVSRDTQTARDRRPNRPSARGAIDEYT